MFLSMKDMLYSVGVHEQAQAFHSSGIFIHTQNQNTKAFKVSPSADLTPKFFIN